MSREIYRKYCDGEIISDKELAEAVKDYAAAEKALFALGPSFEIARKAVSEVRYGLDRIKLARSKKLTTAN